MRYIKAIRNMKRSDVKWKECMGELDALPEEYVDVLRNYGGKERFNLS